ncbi:hypothetical protein RND71_041729 [Anisodus tanguticus]|uniref:Alpha/beta hydrolase fold-3 domain-containing protein n=1 Tax=Anisodus tanguticus TaxID=243964 RepID=A0AAE1URE6_9SOLA|nr:hypothetical protein RND71_041729 [Anisodus tanguticus]
MASNPKEIAVDMTPISSSTNMAALTDSVLQNMLHKPLPDPKMSSFNQKQGLAPENPLATTYEDSWDSFQWVLSHANGKGPNSWINDHADFSKVFIGG